MGALAGGLVGNYMGEQQRAMEEALVDDRARHDFEIHRLEDASLRISVPADVCFDFDSADIKPEFHSALARIARVMVEFERTVIHVVGHTDSIGSAAYNFELSERRVFNLGSYILAQGVGADRLLTEGRGETEPRASNEMEQGRRLNRRMEIVVRPIVEGEEWRARQPPGPSGAGPP